MSKERKLEQVLKELGVSEINLDLLTPSEIIQLVDDLIIERIKRYDKLLSETFTTI
jgi:hypothetical protein